MRTSESQNEVRSDGSLELARRFAAAYASYVAGYSGVDCLLKRTGKNEVAQFWKGLAEFASYALAGGQGEDSQFRQMFAKYIR